MVEIPSDFPWRAGMRVNAALVDATIGAAIGTVVDVWPDGLPVVWWPDINYTRAHALSGHLLPVAEDAATLGALLGAVRERFPGAHAEPNGAAECDSGDEFERANWWAVYAPGGPRLATGDTEFTALLAAWNARPGKS